MSIATNAQLYNFVDDLEDAEIVGIVYPIILKKTNGQLYTINNNIELEDTIDAAVDESNSGSNFPELHDILTNGTWHISYCYYDFDETNTFAGYDFSFIGVGNEGNVIAAKNNTFINGEWQVEINSSTQSLKLHFDDNVLHDLESEWKVKEYTSSYVRLKREGSSNEYYYLSFTKN